MTTGRINQVTSLIPGSPRRVTPREPPTWGVVSVTRMGDHRWGVPATRVERAGHKRHHVTIQLPPLSFSRRGPQRGILGPGGRHTPLHAPLKWRGFVPGSTPEGGYRLESSPENLVRTVAIHQPSTDSIACPPAQRTYGASVPRNEPMIGANRKGPDLSAREQTGGCASPMVYELTRVNIACRHVENEVCNQETMQPKAAGYHPKRQHRRPGGAKGDRGSSRPRLGIRPTPPPLTLVCAI